MSLWVPRGFASVRSRPQSLRMCEASLLAAPIISTAVPRTLVKHQSRRESRSRRGSDPEFSPGSRLGGGEAAACSERFAPLCLTLRNATPLRDSPLRNVALNVIVGFGAIIT